MSKAPGVALPTDVDVAVVGAGTAGAAASACLAERGFRVLCVDRGSLDAAGATWVNGVPSWCFAAAGLAAPTGDELRCAGAPMHLVAGWGLARLRIDGHDVVEVDMRHLVGRLQRRAAERGAVLAGGVGVRGLDDGILVTDRGRVRARWIVDAAGLTGPRLLGQPRVDAADLCAAAQEVRQVVDPAAARAFFARHEVPPGEALCFTGIAGGFSVVNVRYDGDTVSILTGSIPADGHPSGRALLDRFVAEQSWIGGRLFGGSRALPLRRPFDRLTDGQVVLLGDAAAQVFPAHGSGIGAQLVAARLLADCLADPDNGGGAWGYARRWMRQWGGLFASYDLFRRFSQTLTQDDLARMMSGGLLDVDLARCGLDQRHPQLAVAALPAKAVALAAEPALAARLGRVVARMVAVRALFARYPAQPRGLALWSRAATAVCG